MDYNGDNIPGLEGNIALGDNEADQPAGIEEAKNGFQPENANAHHAGNLNADDLNTLDEPVSETIVSKAVTRLSFIHSYLTNQFRKEIW